MLALHFPHLPTDRIARKKWGLSWRSHGRPEAAPIVCSSRLNNTMRLTALDEAAETLNLRKHMGVAEARAIYPTLDVIEDDPAANRRFLEAIADWCDRYTPLVALDGVDGLFLDITGCAHLFGGETPLLKDILARLFQMGIDARGAISSSPGLSWAISRFGQGGIIEHGEAEQALAPLPVAALRLEDETIGGLDKMGLKYVGDLLTAPRAPLARRFGGAVLLRLDQALGTDEEPVSPRLPVASLSVERRLIEPIGAEDDILALTGQVAVSLKPSLEARGVGGRIFELVLFRVDGKVFRISAGTAQPLREPKRIAALFAERLQAIHDDFDAGYGFEILRLNVLLHEDFVTSQGDFEHRQQKDASLAAFVDRVSARLGEDCLQTFQLRESHIPERAYTTVPAIEHLSAPKTREGHLPPARSERPIRLLRKAEPMDAFAIEIPDGAPASFHWRRMQHRVLKSEGPERLAMEWWLDGVDGKDAGDRDYFRIEDDKGRRFWIYRQGHYERDTTQSWFMHGVIA
ncbi:DNA polymerase Y family protein [Rhizobium sp. RHZ02]|uniref:Y-family DNA polymerase n=1 Tax=unclassified Rhizobium TaxID=2613769 RepID=UPI0028AE3814|nr:DNA polymerase Y family protein [Rhizobium sp. RHZ02]